MANKRLFAKVWASLVCFVLITAIALAVSGCQKPKNTVAQNPPKSAVSAEQQTVQFTFIVVDGEGNEESFEITTTETTVGAALLKEGLIDGEAGQLGLYVKTVNGITADYDKDGTYWAFYINGEYALTGVDETDITAGATYSFKVEKG